MITVHVHIISLLIGQVQLSQTQMHVYAAVKAKSDGGTIDVIVTPSNHLTALPVNPG
jgi:hypothetical protein